MSLPAFSSLSNLSLSDRASAHQYGVVTAALQLAKNDEGPTYLGGLMLFSLLCHALLIAALVAIFFLLDFFGIQWITFDPLTLKSKDIQFILVDTPEAPPRDPNTKNRAEHASRSGGKKTLEDPTMTAQRKAGTVTSKPQPSVKPQQASKPTPQRKPTPRPQPQQNPTPQRKPTPPRPQASAPKPTPKSTQPVAPPSPVIPTIKTPSAPTPVATGPVLPSPSGASSSSRSSSSPTQIPTGGLGAQSRPGMAGAPGSVGGSGGSGRENRFGSAGGGGGPAGIDALPDPDYGSYMAELQRRIKRNWRPPRAQEDKRVVVLFRIGRDGRLLSLSIKVSSGYTEADEAAKSAVRLSSPFRPLPPGHREADLPVEFTFDYNVYRSR